jgi:hypothetical protein
MRESTQRGGGLHRLSTTGDGEQTTEGDVIAVEITLCMQRNVSKDEESNLKLI